MNVGGISGSIAMASMINAQGTSMSQVGTALLSKALEEQENTGEGIVKMINAADMERSVNPNIGGNFDMSV